MKLNRNFYPNFLNRQLHLLSNIELYDISKKESILLDQVSGYMKEKLGEKQTIDEEIKQANNVLQSKKVNIETIDEHIR
jgi:hypothetical protein